MDSGLEMDYVPPAWPIYRPNWKDTREMLLKCGIDEGRLPETWAPGIDLSGVYLEGAWLEKAFLARVNFTGAIMKGAILNDSVLTQAVLDGANLADATLMDCRLRTASLVGVDLSYADMTGVQAEWADFTGARILGCSWDGAGLDHAKGILSFCGGRHRLVHVLGTRSATIGCRTMSIDDWLGAYGAYVANANWYTEGEKSMYRCVLEMIDRQGDNRNGTHELE